MPSADLQLGVAEKRHEQWAPVATGADRWLVYGPRLGRLYLISQEELRDRLFRAVLGLRASDERSRLEDPARGIHFDRTSFIHSTKLSAPNVLARMYRLFNASRRFASLRVVATRTQANALRVRRRRGSRCRHAPQIGRAVFNVERTLGFADCYPRALLTLHLAILYGLPCTLAVGVLAPTRKMHAWCTIEDVVPYEALPEHYLYQPLWLAEFAAAQ
jgi:transglutaminase superfamily protein